ncbi:hypothetical protein E2C01_086438 [Portunus trituberculatus]|uniref:Uncharacterized protein n=1 Tax=Portunus trituberculatus TaxID=210409 RepID=A0A5B7JAA8_PORTR|nr:hypothetical protein [Portunus trituberculatus]
MAMLAALVVMYGITKSVVGGTIIKATLGKNSDVPFAVKRRVFDVTFMFTLLYGCESWLGADDPLMYAIQVQ